MKYFSAQKNKGFTRTQNFVTNCFAFLDVSFGKERKPFSIDRAKGVISNKTSRSLVSGFSLLEILLYISILAIIGVSVSQSANSVLSSKLRKEVRATVRQEADYIMKLLVENTLLANGVNTPASGSDVTLSLSADDSQINPTVFALSGTNLTLKKGSGSTLQLNSDRVTIDSFRVTNYTGGGGPGNIEVEFALSYNNATDFQETTYSESFKTNVSIRR